MEKPCLFESSQLCKWSGEFMEGGRMLVADRNTHRKGEVVDAALQSPSIKDRIEEETHDVCKSAKDVFFDVLCGNCITAAERSGLKNMRKEKNGR